MQNNLLNVASRVEPIVNGNNCTYQRMNVIDGVEQPFSLEPCPMFFGINFIEYPTVKPKAYLINTQGVIFSLLTNTYLSIGARRDYLQVDLRTGDGLSRSFSLHRLVAYAFCNPPHDWQDMVVNHIDGNRHNNWANNLEWISVSANNQHGMARAKLSDGETPRAFIDDDLVNEICRLFSLNYTNVDILRKLGLDVDTANQCLLNDIRGGRTWVNISSKYTFNRRSTPQPYTKEETEQVKQLMLQGKNDYEIYSIVTGIPFTESQRKELKFKRLHSIRFSTWGYQNLQHRIYDK